MPRKNVPETGMEKQETENRDQRPGASLAQNAITGRARDQASGIQVGFGEGLVGRACRPADDDQKNIENK